MATKRTMSKNKIAKRRTQNPGGGQAWIVPLVLLGGGAVAVYALYQHYKTVCTATPSTTGFTGFMCDLVGVTTTPAPAPSGSPAPPPSAPPTPPPVPPPVVVTPIVAPPVSIVSPFTTAAALMTAAAGNSQNFDQWSWYFQNLPPAANTPPGFGTPGSISPGLMAVIIALGGGDRTASITAQQFLGFYQQAVAAGGLSGLGRLGARPAGVPGWMVYGQRRWAGGGGF